MSGTISNIEKQFLLKKLELNSILEITQAINNNLSEDSLLKIYRFTLLSELRITNARLSIFDRFKWSTRMLIGSEADFENVEDVLVKTDKTESTVLPNDTHYEIFVAHNKSFLAVLQIDIANPTVEKDTIEFIQLLTNIIVVAIENKRMAREQLKQEALKKEIEIAKNLQKQLFPRNLPNNNEIKTCATYIPHESIGGDYYDFLQIAENEFLVCIADVSGKGVSAALLMSNFQASLRALASFQPDLTELVKMLNKYVKANANGEKFITFFIAKYNTLYRKLTYVNAGHNPPVIKTGKEYYFLEEGTTLLGVFDDLPFIKQGETKIAPNSLLFLYTDGLSELKNKNGDDFGLDKITEYPLDNFNNEEFNQYIIRMADEFREEVPYNDDVSMFSVFLV